MTVRSIFIYYGSKLISSSVASALFLYWSMVVFSCMNVHLCMPVILLRTTCQHPYVTHGAVWTPIHELTDLSVTLDSLSHQVCLHCVLMTPLLPEKVSYLGLSLISLPAEVLPTNTNWFHCKNSKERFARVFRVISARRGQKSALQLEDFGQFMRLQLTLNKLSTQH